MAPENLKVDTDALKQAGANFLAASDAIPEAPAAYIPGGTDPLSARIAELAPQFLAPIASGLSALKAATSQFAKNISAVADRYAATDAQLHSKLSAQVGGSGSGGGAGGGGTASAASGVAGAVGGSGAGAAGAASQGAGQLGQMMQMPMQMASQAAQIPQQVMGMAGQLPQTAMQGVQQIAEQISQVAGKAGGAEKPEDKPEEEKDREGKHRREDSPDAAEPVASAAPGTTPSERAPEDPHRHASPRPSSESVL
ncbi:MAG: hypothetical protein HYZ39_18040 [Mycolicibacterium cosmeticum]|nr:hypothetical protein [Mycolicibacterium cosmeticum]